MSAEFINQEGFIVMQEEKIPNNNFPQKTLQYLRGALKTLLFFWKPLERQMTMQKILLTLKKVLIEDKFWEKVIRFHNFHNQSTKLLKN